MNDSHNFLEKGSWSVRSIFEVLFVLLDLERGLLVEFTVVIGPQSFVTLLVEAVLVEHILAPGTDTDTCLDLHSVKYSWINLALILCLFKFFLHLYFYSWYFIILYLLLIILLREKLNIQKRYDGANLFEI